MQMINLKIDYNKALDFVSKEEIHKYQEEINSHFKAINQKLEKEMTY